MKDRYAKMTDDEFDAILAAILDKMDGASILQIPGVYSEIAEHFNNEVLEKWEQDHPEEEGDE